MRQATENDRTVIAKHVLTHYLRLVESDPDEYLHQVAKAPQTFPHLFYANVFAKGHHLIMYDLTGKNVIATGGLTPDETDWKMVSMYVDGKYRGHGIGTSFVSELIRVAREKGVKKITLCTMPNHMPKAFRLYMKFGFELKKEMQPEKYVCSSSPNRSMVYQFYELEL